MIYYNISSSISLIKSHFYIQYMSWYLLSVSKTHINNTLHITFRAQHWTRLLLFFFWSFFFDFDSDAKPFLLMRLQNASMLLCANLMLIKGDECHIWKNTLTSSVTTHIKMCRWQQCIRIVHTSLYKLTKC